MKSFYIEILGCPMRAIEAQRLNDYFLANGLILSNADKADIHAIFTCSVVDDTESKTFSYIEALDLKKRRVILLGCTPGMSPQKISSRFSLEMIPTSDLEIKIDKLFPEFKTKFAEIPLPTSFKPDYQYGIYYLNQFEKYTKRGLFGKKRTRPVLFVTSKGCNNNCTYCTMKRALGPVKSYSPDMLVANYYKLRENGNEVFIFNADDTGAYGIDMKITFSYLLNRLRDVEKELKLKKPVWIIDNLHPIWALKYRDVFYEFISGGIITEIIIPLQAASDNLLKLMKRKYGIDDILDCLKHFKSGNAGLQIKTHFIIGFPSESEDDINAIMEIIKGRLFNHIIFLKYFETEDSPSGKFIPKIPEKTVDERLECLKPVLLDSKTEFMIDGTFR